MNKKGVSILIGYVLLIVIAISLSMLVYSWLRGQVPKESEECPDGISLILENYECNSSEKTIELTLKNRGRFDLSGFILKGSKETEGLATCNIYTAERYTAERVVFPDNVLRPGEKHTQEFNYENCIKVEKIEIIPIYSQPKPLLCNKAIITQKIEGCN